MSKCQSCERFTYKAGISLGLQKMTGINGPTSPTCYCDYANVQWARHSGEIKKPFGIKCDYKIRVMHCDECGKLLKSNNDIWMKLTQETYICKKCGGKKK